MLFKVDFKMNVTLTKNLSLDEVSKCKALGWDGILTKFLSKTFRSHGFCSIESFFLKIDSNLCWSIYHRHDYSNIKGR
jgi:hypothetical protein